MASLLVGDIGGTHSRFGRVAGDAARPQDVLVLKGDDYPAFEDAVAAYLGVGDERPRRAAFAVAGPVSGRAVRLTNRGWTIDADALAARFGFESVEILNDFVAQAAALPYLEGDDLQRIGAVRPRDATKAAVGPGTGVGVAALLRDGPRWLPVASEGGHVEMAAIDEREAAAFALIRRECGRASVENVLAGAGLARLHLALAAVDGRSADALSPGGIVAAAGGGDRATVETIATFLEMLARFAGDVALTFGARGGVYLCGGVAERLRSFVDERAFRKAFEAKHPHEALMRETATLLVASPLAGLIGCAAAAKSQHG